MPAENLRDAQEENSCAINESKRSREDAATAAQSHHREKRIRMVSETKTENPTLKIDSPINTFCSNRFWPIQRSSQKQNWEKRREPYMSSSSSSSSSSGEGNRKWVFSSDDVYSSEDRVVVVSYNILGVENASNHPDLYFKVSYKSLEWNQRKKLIREEINRYNASILCFQEVDCFNDVNDAFREDGFRGVYKARTGEACDGCAIFWKEELFSLLHEENIEFKNFGLRDNVAQLCILKMKQNLPESIQQTQTSTTLPTRSRNLLIGNIHVLFNPRRGDIKLGQVRLFLEKAYKLSQEWGGIPVIIAGDFNCVPQSAIYQFLASSELDIQLHDCRKVSGQIEGPSQWRAFKSQNEMMSRSISMPMTYRWSAEELMLATGSEGVAHLQHHLNLRSAYHGVPGSWRTRDNYGEPLATSYHSKFMGTVDYIWHTEDLVSVRVLETLPLDVLRSTGGLPSEKWGSDHLALVCELAFVDESTTT